MLNRKAIILQNLRLFKGFGPPSDSAKAEGSESEDEDSDSLEATQDTMSAPAVPDSLGTPTQVPADPAAPKADSAKAD